jgi:hypothetical protein
MKFAIILQLGFFNLKIKLWQLTIKLTHLLYWYIVESIFQLASYLLNILDIFKLKAQLC